MKQQIFIDNEYQYDYEVDGEIHRLSYCNTEFWSDHVRGTVAFEIKDDGNGMNIISLFDKNDIEYCTAEQLEILLRLLNQKSIYEVSTKKPL